MARSALAVEAVSGSRSPRLASRTVASRRDVGRVEHRPAHSVNPYLLDDITMTRDELLAARGYQQAAGSERRAA